MKVYFRGNEWNVMIMPRSGVELIAFVLQHPFTHMKPITTSDFVIFIYALYGIVSLINTAAFGAL